MTRRGACGTRATRTARPESELQRYLEEAKAVLDAATSAPSDSIADLVSADFEHLRWFDLPSACLHGA